MRRTRKDATKVWHNPDINTFSKRGGGNGGPARVPAESAEDRRASKQHRAALEALFAPKREPEADDAAKAKNGSAAKSNGRIVLAPPPQADSRAAERQKLLGRLLVAEGRPSVSKAADAFLAAGFVFPDEQDVYLQLLEHAREEHVRSAIDKLDSILAGELPKRRAVLESRLRRIEQFAEDEETREAAARLRRRVSGRAVGPAPAPSAPGSVGGSAQTPGPAGTPPSDPQ